VETKLKGQIGFDGFKKLRDLKSIKYIVLYLAKYIIMDGKGKGKEEQDLKQLHYRLTITSRDVKAIENGIRIF
jgi:hypothetical protein